MNEKKDQDWVTVAGLVVVGAAAAITSFTELVGLADHAGWKHHLGLLLPANVDVYGFTATRIWLSPSSGDETKKHAKAHAFIALMLSMMGNAINHALDAKALVLHSNLWVLIVLVSLVPPATLGALMHLVTLRGRDRAKAAEATEPLPNRASGPATEPAARLASGGPVGPNRAIAAPRPSQATEPTVPVTKPSTEPVPSGTVPGDQANQAAVTESDSAPVEKKPGGRPAKAAKARAVEIYREHHRRGVILNDRSLMKLVNDEFGEEVIGRTACGTVIRKQREAMRVERTG